MNAFFRNIAFFGVYLFPLYAISGEIGYGQINSIKQYDFTNNKSVVVILEGAATHTNPACLSNGMIHGNISYTEHEAGMVNSLLSMSMAAYMAGKKVRLYSETNNSCEIDFIGIQDTFF